MDKEFEKLADEFEKDWRESKPYQNIAGKGYNEHAKFLFALYIQHKSQQKLIRWTIGLVVATWALAIGTLMVLILK